MKNMSNVKRLLNESAVARWSVLLLLSITMMANYWFYDVLSPLKDLLETHLNIKDADYGFLVSSYSIA